MHSLAGCLKVSPTWFIPKMTATANATADDSNNTIYIANILLSSRMENVQTRHGVLETFILVSRNLVSLFSKTPSSEQRTRTLNTAYITTAKSWSSQQQTKYYENTSSIVTKSLLLDWWHSYIVQLTTMESTSLTFKAFGISKVVWEILWRHTWKIKKSQLVPCPYWSAGRLHAVAIIIPAGDGLGHANGNTRNMACVTRQTKMSKRSGLCEWHFSYKEIRNTVESHEM